MVIFISPVVFFFLVEIDRSLLSFFFVFKLVFIDFLRLQIWLKWHTRIRRGAANPAHWTGAANWRLGFPSSGLFSTLFIDLYGCHLFLKLFFFRFANWWVFVFIFFSSSNWLNDVLRLKICLKWLISIRITFCWLLVTLEIAVYFNFINHINFINFINRLIFLICLFVCVVLFLAQRKICLGLLKKVLFS